MFKRILIPLDGSAESEAAIEEADRLMPRGGTAFLLHVIPPATPAAGSPLPLMAIPDRAQEYLEKLADRYSRINTRLFVDSGDPAERILKVALSLNIDLVAMTTRARTGLSRLLLGSVAQQVVRHSALPVLLTRPGMRRPAAEIRRIVVPLDATAEAAPILEVVKPIARGTASEILLVHVTEALGDVLPAVPPDRPLQTFARNPMRRLQRIADGLGREAIAAMPIVAPGKPVEEILRQARALEADLIVMATRSPVGVERLVVGSVAEGVLRKSDCAVLLLRTAPVPRMEESGRPL